MLRTVLVPLDGSALGEVALKPATHLARQNGGVIYLMRVPVFPDRMLQVSPDFDDTIPHETLIPEYDDASSYLHEVCDKITQPGISVRTRVVAGDRADAIVNTAAIENADIIIMATHARSGLPRWLMGSVAGEVLRQTPTPVLLLRKPTPISHILITLDGSELSEQIIPHALDLAQAFDSHVTFLRIEDASRGAEARDYVNTIIERHAPTDIEVHGEVLSGSVVEQILDYIAQERVNLVAMSTHGRSGLRKLIYGSVTDKVMCDSGCAMLIVHPLKIGAE